MAQVENKPGVPTQDLSFLKEMKTVKEMLGNLNRQELAGLSFDDRKKRVEKALKDARESYLGRGWMDNSKKVELVLSSLTNGEITPEAILQAINDNEEKEKPAKKGWRSLFKRG